MSNKIISPHYNEFTCSYSIPIPHNTLISSIAGPIQIKVYSSAKHNKVVYLFSDSHVINKNIICPNSLYVTDYLHSLFSNNNIIFDVFIEYSYFFNRNLYKSNFFTSTSGLILCIKSFFGDCIIPKKDSVEQINCITSRKYNNVRFHSIDIRSYYMKNNNNSDIINDKGVYNLISMNDTLYVIIEIINLIKYVNDNHHLLDTLFNKCTKYINNKNHNYQQLISLLNYPNKNLFNIHKCIATNLSQIIKIIGENIESYKNLKDNGTFDALIKYSNNFSYFMNTFVYSYNKNMDTIKIYSDISEKIWTDLIYSNPKLKRNTLIDSDILVQLKKYIGGNIKYIIEKHSKDFHKMILFMENNNIFQYKSMSDFTFLNTNIRYLSIFVIIISSCVMDVYTIGRMFKKFSNKSQSYITKETADNIIVIAGKAHNDFYSVILEKIGFVMDHEDNNEKDKCVKLNNKMSDKIFWPRKIN